MKLGGEVEYFKDFWSKERDGKHLFRTEEFYEKEAKEQLYHLSGGESLLDFGCGSAELLVYCAKEYKVVVGVDFSKSMLAEAQKRLEERHISHVKLMHADDKTVWNNLYASFDRIISYGVTQYFNAKQLDNFIYQASRKINPRGKIILFTVLEPSTWLLRRLGIFDPDNKLSPVGVVKAIAFMFLKRLIRFIKRRPPNDIGYAYSPRIIKIIATKYNLKMEYVWSMYYADRYHVVLSLD